MFSKIKKGFVGVEAMVVAAIILSTGLFGVVGMSERGQALISSGMNTINSLIFGADDTNNPQNPDTPVNPGTPGVVNPPVVDPTQPVPGFPEGIVVLPRDINAEGDFIFEWNTELYGWTITSFVNTIDKDVVIPATRLDGVSIVAIGNNAFIGAGLQSVVIPTSVRHIGDSAFRNNNLTSVILPTGSTPTSVVVNPGIRHHLIRPLASLMAVFTTLPTAQMSNTTTPNLVIGAFAFSGNSLTSIVIPEGVRSIATATFSNNQLTSIVLPSTLLNIQAAGFENNLIQSVVFPNTLTSLASFSFRNNKISEVVLPASLISMQDSVFQNNELTSVKFMGQVPASMSALNPVLSGNANIPQGGVKVSSARFTGFRNAINQLGITLPQLAVFDGDENLEDNIVYR